MDSSLVHSLLEFVEDFYGLSNDVLHKLASSLIQIVLSSPVLIGFFANLAVQLLGRISLKNDRLRGFSCDVAWNIVVFKQYYLLLFKIFYESPDHSSSRLALASTFQLEMGACLAMFLGKRDFNSLVGLFCINVAKLCVLSHSFYHDDMAAIFCFSSAVISLFWGVILIFKSNKNSTDRIDSEKQTSTANEKEEKEEEKEEVLSPTSSSTSNSPQKKEKPQRSHSYNLRNRAKKLD